MASDLSQFYMCSIFFMLNMQSPKKEGSFFVYNVFQKYS